MRRQSPAEKKAECIPADNRIFHQSKTKIRNPRGPITEVSFPFFTSTFRLEINSMPVISFFSPNLAVSTDSSKVSEKGRFYRRVFFFPVWMKSVSAGASRNTVTCRIEFFHPRIVFCRRPAPEVMHQHITEEMADCTVHFRFRRIQFCIPIRCKQL